MTDARITERTPDDTGGPPRPGGAGPVRLPVIAIVGRPNVGKSALFNRIARRRIAIVEPTHGVTRDRISCEMTVDDRPVELVDTGGITDETGDTISRQVQDQVRFAIARADVILFVVDVREGPTPADHEVANLLRGVEKPILLVANKADTRAEERDAVEFFELGFGEAIPVSGLHGVGSRDLIEQAVSLLPAAEEAPPSPTLSFALVGRRNVGKSTYVNALARDNRMIVSEIPGTTRDSVDIRFERGDKTYLAIDTAGLRKKGKLDDAIEFFGRVRAEESIRRANVVILMIDATEGIARTDKKITEMITDAMKPCVIVINKWDIRQPEWTEEFVAAEVRKQIPGVAFAPVVFMSALERQDILAPLKMAEELHEQAGVRASTSDVNRIIRAAFEEKSPRVKGNVQPKLFYAAQVGTHPPHFLFFVNRTKLFTPHYRRYFGNRLREHLRCKEVPVRLTFKDRNSAEEKPRR